jgi:hypothetical protein
VKSTNNKKIALQKGPERKFFDDYMAKTKKYWLNTIPRSKVRHFMWKESADVVLAPPLRVSETQVMPTKDMKRTVTKMQDSPRIFHIERFLSDYECDYLVETANKNLSRSTVRDTGVIDPYRTSRTAWLHCDKDSIVQEICERAFKLLGYKWSQDWENDVESLQVIHYSQDQEFRVCLDFTISDFHMFLASL